jgi:predicted PurR-regulated permease PerM
MSEPLSSEKTVQNYVFGAILILLFIAVCRLFAPFFTVFLWSILFYILLSPLHQRVIKNIDFSNFKGKILKNIWAGVFAVGTLVIVLIPLFFLGFQFFKQIIELINFARDMLNAKPEILRNIIRDLSGLIEDISAGQIVISADDIQRRITELLSSSLQGVIQLSGNIVRDIGSFVLGLLLMVFCLFFYYADGPYLSGLVLHAVPIRKEYHTALIGKFMDITRNLFLGYIMVSLIQAFIAYIIFVIFSVKGALVFAGLTFICVFIPMLGGGIVWLPLGIARILNGNLAGGIAFLVVSGIFISSIDNFLRPFFLRNRIHLHPLFIFFAILGGISVSGFNGLVLGPIAVILFLTVLDLFLTEHNIRYD